MRPSVRDGHQDGELAVRVGAVSIRPSDTTNEYALWANGAARAELPVFIRHLDLASPEHEVTTPDTVTGVIVLLGDQSSTDGLAVTDSAGAG